jgi:serine protease Do
MTRFLILMLAAWFAVGLTAQAQQVPLSPEQISLSFAPVVKKAAPAVVNIYAKRVVKQRVSVSPFMNDPVFRQFFGNSPLATGPVRERVERSLGSGVIVKDDGLVVTSHHVIKDATDIIVVLSDRREIEAKVVKRDAKTDLAFLQIDAKQKLPYLEMRDSDSLEVGELVLAIGNPFGVGQTVTQGIISALARSAAGVSDYGFFVQTDAAINPGNSGGALVDIQGRLIGINTAIYSTSGSSSGIGFAIPANMVKAVQASDVKEGKVVRPYFGIAAQPVTAEIAESMGLSSPRGALVRQIMPASPADKSGIKEGDLIVSLDGHEILDEKALAYRIGITVLGKPVEIRFLRGGKEQAVTLSPVLPPKDESDARALKGNHPLTGLTVATLTPTLALELGMEEAAEQGGVVVLGGKGSGAFSLRKGDIIIKLNNRDVTGADQLESLLSTKTRSWQITVLRGGSVLNLSIRI